MNPKAGSFTINPRLLRHFVVFALSAPSDDALQTIYTSLFNGFLTSDGFSKAISKISVEVVQAAVLIHEKVAASFLPTAIKFHYLFNLRDLTNVFEGIKFSTPEVVKTPLTMVRLLVHETTRVYSDKMVTTDDLDRFKEFQSSVIKEKFPDLEEEKLVEEPNIFCHFAQGSGESKYSPTKSWKTLFDVQSEALNNYNDVNAAMNLVLFHDALEHVCRINRILEMPRGNALLVGVGGSGKQSLARLSASIKGLETFQMALTKGYGINELKADLMACYIKAGQKDIGTMFLMTDAQVADEKFLVLINDLLSSGEIPGLFGRDEKDEVIDAVRSEVKSSGEEDTNINCWKFFIRRVRENLKVVLCFSPVGGTLRARARMFPAVVNCTSIDWFHDWPYDALCSVSAQFLEDNELIPQPLKPSISQFMASVHTSVNDMSKIYLENERRYNYTTPKSFLEQVSLYQTMLEGKMTEIQGGMDRMENGLTKLNATAAQVDDMKEKLAAQEIELGEKNEAANKLIERVGVESAKGQKDRDSAAAEQAKVGKLSAEVGKKKEDCARDLALAEPALKAAQEALNTLNKNNLGELKSFGSPPPICIEVVGAAMCLFAKNGKIPKQKDRDWKSCKSFMGNVGEFLDNLINYDKENVPAAALKEVKSTYLPMPEFQADIVKGKSQAAAGLCSWVINIITFYEVFCDVAPKRLALAEATATLQTANEKLAKIMSKIKQLDDALQVLKDEFQKATDAKLACQAEADKTSKVIGLANRLVGGLAGEKIRWGESVEKFKIQMTTIPGDCLLTTAFLSYTGCFSKTYRTMMMEEHWLPFFDKCEPKIPQTEGLDPLDLLATPSIIAGWQNENLPADRVSTENAAILTSAKRWPLIIDPQEQGIKWIKTREGDGLVVVRLGQKGYLDKIERAISDGQCLFIENIFEEVDAVLGDVIGRNTIKKGRAIMIGDKEVEYNSKFRLILHTKMGNPHYKPEMQAQCTLINFTVTQSGLEDQLLADVVGSERADLQELKAKLTKEQNEFMITLKELEDNLLAKLSSAEGNFLEDEALVVGLEETKKTAEEIEEKVKLATTTEIDINKARERYRPASARGALLYFILNVLEKLHPMYQVSLKSFNVVFMYAVTNAPKDEDVDVRVRNIIDTVTYQVYQYMSRGLFQQDKLIFATMMVIAIERLRGELKEDELQFLLRCPGIASPSPVDFLTAAAWGNIKALSAMEAFANLDKDIEGSAKRWAKYCEGEVPERDKLPGDWKAKTTMQQLCMLRCLRPDRMMNAMEIYIGESLGEKYVGGLAVDFAASYKETTSHTGVFFILSPGVNPIAYVEKLGQKMGFTEDNGKYHFISLGQGQEVIAEAAMKKGAEEGHWVVLENIHIVVKWLKTLEKTMEDCSATAHPDFRFYLTAEPASAEYHIMPSGILQACIKITNEPPAGVKANLHEALNCFDQERLESCAKENEFRKILFALVYHHAVLIERRKFGPIGWNVPYPFNKGDLVNCADVLFNYLENNSVPPWLDMRYIFGEIMYGGHITDNIDRRLEYTYLLEYLQPEMLDADIELAPGFLAPPPLDFVDYHTYIDEQLPAESPYLYGLHPNAEIDYLTNTSARLFGEVLGMQTSKSAASSGGKTKGEIVKDTLDEFMEKLPEGFNMFELDSRVPPEERTPYVNAAFQEVHRMNRLISAIRKDLKDVSLGLKGELTVTPYMEGIEGAIFLDGVPPGWGKILGPSTRPLGAWFADVTERVKFLEAWTADFALPNSVWLGGLFNPQAFLTAILQQTARKNQWPLDKVVLTVDATKKYNKDDFTSPPREGAYLYGLYMAGARWDTQTGLIQEARLKELCPPMPVMFCKAIPVEKEDLRNTYSCPTFKTVERGRATEAVAVGLCPGFVWYFNLKTKQSANKWTLAGCAMTLSD
jgi:dynein heavy chain